MEFKAGKGAAIPGLIILKAGESVTGILRGNPVEFEDAFKAGDKPRFRFRLNIVVKENAVLVPKVFEGGWKIYQALKELNDAGWNLEETYIRISRTGSGVQDTVYSAAPIPQKPDAATLAKVSAVKLLDIAPKGPQAAPQAGQPDSFEDVPF